MVSVLSISPLVGTLENNSSWWSGGLGNSFGVFSRRRFAAGSAALITWCYDIFNSCRAVWATSGRKALARVHVFVTCLFKVKIGFPALAILSKVQVHCSVFACQNWRIYVFTLYFLTQNFCSAFTCANKCGEIPHEANSGVKQFTWVGIRCIPNTF